MRFDKTKKIHLVAARDQTRYSIQNVSYEISTHGKRKGRLIATNGRTLAVVNVEAEEEDTPCEFPNDARDIGATITAEAIKSAIKGAKRFPARIEANGSLIVSSVPGGPLVTYPRECTARFPAWREVVPKTAGELILNIDAKLLWELVQAIGLEGPVRLEIGEEGTPIIARRPFTRVENTGQGGKGGRPFSPEGDEDFGVITPMGDN